MRTSATSRSAAPLYRSFTVAETIEFARRTNSRWDDEIVDDVLSHVSADTKVGSLSTGDRARLALALALGKRPRLVLLDEPFARLDPLAGREFLQLLMDGVAETGATVVIASHVIADIERVCDHIVLLTGGGVRLEGDVEELLESHRILMGPRRPLGSIRGVSEIVRERHGGRQLTLLVRSDGPIVGPLVDGSSASGSRSCCSPTWRRSACRRPSRPRGFRCDGMGDVAAAPRAARRGARAARRARASPRSRRACRSRTAYHRDALAGCLPPTSRSGCDIIVRHFESQFDSWVAALRGLAVLPALAGVFVGAPLLARELEHDTHRFAWTQGVTRRRWLLSKTALLAAGTVVIAAAPRARSSCGGAARSTRSRGGSRRAASTSRASSFRRTRCSRSPLGVLAGLVFRRTRGRDDRDARRLRVDAADRAWSSCGRTSSRRCTASSSAPTPCRRPADWVLSDTLVDAGGRQITAGREDLAVLHAQHAGIDPQTYLVTLGWKRVVAYQPAGRFWTFQLIEAGIFVALAVALVLTTLWLVRRTPT